jgi:MoxR-like ATPase
MSEDVDAAACAGRLSDALNGVLIGQASAVEGLLVAYMAGGHALLEGAPGVGKTLLASAFAAALGVRFARIQFTPDLMPTDVSGANVFDPATRAFRLMPGPLFTQVLMADEINRTPPKTQSALLEAMQEGQATIDGTSHALPAGFFVVATQNPVEFEGTYPLPEAQLDRFLLRIEIGLPDAGAEIDVFRRAVRGGAAARRPALPSPVVSPEEAQALRLAAAGVHVADELFGYLHQLATAVRRSPHVELGVSPRGALAALEAGRAYALLSGRDFLVPDDLKRVLPAAWAHRIVLSPESELEGHSARGAVEEAARAVPVPHTA